MEYIDIGPPVIKNVGDKFVLGVRLTDWLGTDTVQSVVASAVPGVDSLTVGTASVSTTPQVLNGKMTEAGDAVLVPVEVANGDVAVARVLLDIQASNVNKFLNDRAIPVRIVG